MPVTLKCKECGNSFKVPPVRRDSAKYCSKDCADPNRAESRKRRVTMECALCGNAFDVVRCHAGRRTHCSNACREADPAYQQAKSERHSGSGNPMWKGGVVDHSDGYLYELATDHPFASNGYVLQHRLVMERWLRENHPESKFLITVGENLYLSPGFEVHHKDEKRANNAIGNLQCMTRAEHRRHHNGQESLDLATLPHAGTA